MPELLGKSEIRVLNKQNLFHKLSCFFSFFSTDKLQDVPIDRFFISVYVCHE